jgi:serine/threonine protein kinase/tetratricopeptide (TPR) repeat protein
MSPSLPDDKSAPDESDEVEVLAAQFLAQLERGESPDREVVVRSHPHLGALLERRLALVEMMYRAGLAGDDKESTLGGTANAVTFPTPASAASAEHGKARTSAGSPLGPGNDPPGYEILGVLGQGGMGVVYRARQKSLNRVVALKMIRAHASPELLARFHIEAETLASLQHPNIVQICEFGQLDGCPFMAMEFVEGGTLASYLDHRPQPPRAAAELVQTLARAMHAAHQRGIVHRDLKPANILLVSGGGSACDGPPGHTHDPARLASGLLPSPKITDFGLAKRLAEGQGQTATGAIMGTPSYMAPEQAQGRVREIGVPTDVYALGAILYEMLTGAPPFKGDTALTTLRQVEANEPVPPSRVCGKLPRDLETICLKCLEKEPGKRYGTAAELAEDLRRFLDGTPVSARHVRAAERAWKWGKRRPALAALIAVSVTAALALAVVGISWSVQVSAKERRARHNFQVARQAIDSLYTKMASERLFDEPQLDPLCQELLEMAQTLYEELSQEQATDPGLRRDTATAWFRLGEIHRLRAQYPESVRAYHEAIVRQEALAHEDPGARGYRQDLANSHNWLGELFRESARPVEEAREQYRQALGLQQELVGQYPAEAGYRLELARSHYNLGIIEKNSGQLPEARTDCDRAVALLTELHQSDPAEPNVRQDLARARINRGVLHRLTGRPGEAGSDYDQAIDLLTRLREEFPSRAAYKFELAIVRQDRGNLLWSQGRHDLARREHQEALAVLKGLVTDFSSRPRYRKKMGSALKNLGAALASAGDLPGAEQCWNQARTIFEMLARNDPGQADYHGQLGMTLGNLGWLRADQKNWSEARGLVRAGIVQMQAALEPNPQNPDYRQELRSQYRDLAETLVQMGDHAGAAEAANNLAKMDPGRALESYYAACFVARCVPLAQKDEKAAQRYADQATALVRQAASGDAQNLKRLPEESSIFGPLSTYAEFRDALHALDLVAPKSPGKGAH